MATYYVDYEGSAGTGDGSSFANRAGMVRDLSTLSAGDEVRIKKTPDPTSLGTGQVRCSMGHYTYSGGSLSASRIVYSTTDGETKITGMGKGWSTGDIVHISHADTNTGKSISGLWRVTVESGTETDCTLKLDDFPGAPNTTSSSTSAKWVGTANALYLNTGNLTKSIACRDANRSAWTAVSGSGVTCTYSNYSYSDWSSFQTSILMTGHDTIALGTSNPSPGKIAHYQLPNTLDLSGYQQVSFQFKHNTNDNANSGLYSLRLCTDTGGDTSVHTISIDYKKQANDHWTGLTVDLGTNLNSSIKSIALYKDSSSNSGNPTFYFSNIIACKASSAADSITMDSLVGLNTSDDPAWYPIQGIWDNIVFLKTQEQRRPAWGYYGTSSAAFSATNASATIYKRKQLRSDNSYITASGSDYTSWDQQNGSGTESSPITISGGWDSTNMSTRNGKTCVELNGKYQPFYRYGNHVHLSHLYYTNFGSIHNGNKAGEKWSSVGFSHFNSGLVFNSGSSTGIGIDFIISGTKTAVKISGGTHGGSQSDYYIKQASGSNFRGLILDVDSSSSASFDLINCIACGSTPIFVKSACTLTIGTFKWGFNAGTNLVPTVNGGGVVSIDRYDVTSAYYTTFKGAGNLTIDDYNYTKDTTYDPSVHYRYGANRSTTYGFYLDTGGLFTIIDAGTVPSNIFISASVLQVKNPTNNFNYQLQNGGVVEIIGYQGTSGDNRAFFLNNTVITPETTTRHTASGVAWKCTGGTYSPTITLGQIVVSANSAVTVGLWTYKTLSTSEAILKIPADLVRGVTAQEVSSLSASTNTWTKIEKTFTPTSSGPLTIQVELKNAVSFAELYIDDLEVSQA